MCRCLTCFYSKLKFYALTNCFYNNKLFIIYSANPSQSIYFVNWLHSGTYFLTKESKQRLQGREFRKPLPKPSPHDQRGTLSPLWNPPRLVKLHLAGICFFVGEVTFGFVRILSDCVAGTQA